MSMSNQGHSLLRFLAIALVSAACNATSNDVIAANARLSENLAQAAPDATPATPGTDLWAPFLAAAAGNYEAKCESLSIPPDPVAQQNGPLIIAADGSLRAGNVVGNLKPARVVSLGRSREISGKPLMTMSVSSDTVSFGTVEQDDGTKQAAFGRAPDMFECRLAEKVQAGSQSIYAQFAGFFDATSKMMCYHNRTHKANKADYEMAKGIFTIGTRRFDLNALKQETLIMWPEERFFYSANTMDDSSFELDLDAHGKPTHLKLRKKGMKLIECAPLSSAR
jgi:hypothetical protein